MNRSALGKSAMAGGARKCAASLRKAGGTAQRHRWPRSQRSNLQDTFEAVSRARSVQVNRGQQHMYSLTIHGQLQQGGVLTHDSTLHS